MSVPSHDTEYPRYILPSLARKLPLYPMTKNQTVNKKTIRPQVIPIDNASALIFIFITISYYSNYSMDYFSFNIAKASLNLSSGANPRLYHVSTQL